MANNQDDTIVLYPGPTFIKPDQRNPWIKDQLWNDLLSTILHLQLPNSRCEIVGRRVIFIWSLIHGLCWSGLIKAEPVMWSWWCYIIIWFQLWKPILCQFWDLEGSVAEKLSWFIRHLSDGLYLFYTNLWNRIRHLGLAIGNVRHTQWFLLNTVKEGAEGSFCICPSVKNIPTLRREAKVYCLS